MPGRDSDDHRSSAWFDDLFHQHATAVRRYFLRRAAPDDADDLTAEVFVVAWRRREEVPAGAELPWLYRTAGFLLANFRRKGRPTPVGEVPDVESMHDAEASVIDSDEVRRVFDSLSAKDRRVLVLAAWEGLRGEELGTVLGVSRAAADAALFRARTHLAEAWAASRS